MADEVELEAANNEEEEEEFGSNEDRVEMSYFAAFQMAILGIFLPKVSA